MRKTLVKWHLWSGLLLGVIWTIQGITGSLLVFHRHFDQRDAFPLASRPMISIDTLVRIARDETGQPIERITAIGTDLRLVEARYTDAAGKPQAIRLESATGKLVGAREREPTSPATGSFWRWLYLLHISVFAGETGRILIGVSGLFLLASLCIGIYIAWPRRQNWRSIFAFASWRNAFLKLYGWHRAIGIVGSIVLLMLAASGSYMVFDKWLAPVLARTGAFDTMAALGHHGTDETGHGAHPPHISADDALAIAKEIFPSGKFMNVELPQEHPGYYSVRLTLPEEWRTWAGRAITRVDTQTGEITAIYDPTTASFLNKLDDAVYPFHMGEALGLPGRLVVFVAGFALPFFFLTGAWMWLHKKQRRRTR